jgi:3-hydroxybutyryl-CoA dehydratase
MPLNKSGYTGWVKLRGSMKELNGYQFEELSLGMSAIYSRTITDTDLRNFSGVTGDTNPMHLNE